MGHFAEILKMYKRFQRIHRNYTNVCWFPKYSYILTVIHERHFMLYCFEDIDRRGQPWPQHTTNVFFNITCTFLSQKELENVLMNNSWNRKKESKLFGSFWSVKFRKPICNQLLHHSNGNVKENASHLFFSNIVSTFLFVTIRGIIQSWNTGKFSLEITEIATNPPQISKIITEINFSRIIKAAAQSVTIRYN